MPGTESAEFIVGPDGLDEFGPGSMDPASSGDDQIREIKHVLVQSFPHVNGPFDSRLCGQALAEEGENNIFLITALRTKQAIDFQRAYATSLEVAEGTNEDHVITPKLLAEKISAEGLVGPVGPIGPAGPQGVPGVDGEVTAAQLAIETAARVAGDNALKGLSIAYTNDATGARTLALADRTSNLNPKIRLMNHAVANLVTVPADATLSFPTGSVIPLMQNAAGPITVAGEDGSVTVRPPPGGTLVSLNIGAVLILQKLPTAGLWQLSGQVVPA